MLNLPTLLVIVAISMTISFCGNSEKKQEREQEYGDCVRRGVKYFSSIGSYPLLSDGRHADDVARDRCSRTLEAF